jgi:hypothetical protein
VVLSEQAQAVGGVVGGQHLDVLVLDVLVPAEDQIGLQVALGLRLVEDLEVEVVGLEAGGQAAPVVDVVVLVAQSAHQLQEVLAQVVVVRLLVVLQRAGVVQVHRELEGQALAEQVGRQGHLALRDLLVLLGLVVVADALPGQVPLQQVDQHVAQRLQVIPAALLDAEVRVDGRVPGRAHEGAPLPVGHVLVAAAVPVLAAQPEVHHEQVVRLLLQPHQEVFGLEIPVEDVPVVHGLDPLEQLVRQHQHRLEGEALLAHDEQVLEGGAQQVQHDQVAPRLLAGHVHCGEPRAGEQATGRPGSSGS